MVCTPFKTILGTTVEALEAGADTIIMPNGICRLSYYGELLDRILKDAGYEYQMINLNEYVIRGRVKDLLKAVKDINPKIKPTHFLSAGREALKMVEYLDEITGEYYKGCGFDPSGRWRQAYRDFLRGMYCADSGAAIEGAYNTVKREFDTALLQNHEHPIKVGIVGEFYTAVDPFSNRCVEQKLADMGHSKEDILAGICDAVVANYLNNVGKGKKILPPIVFQGGVSRNGGVVAAFEKLLGERIIVDENGHLMGAIGVAIIARQNHLRREFDFSIQETEFKTREANCGKCPNNCEIICVYREDEIIDSWGNRCERGAVH